MFDSTDVWDRYAAKHGIKFMTYEEEFDEVFAELLVVQKQCSDMEPEPSDEPDLDWDEGDTYNEQEETDRLLAEREELEIERKIDEWYERAELAWCDELLAELQLTDQNLSGDFPQPRTQDQPANRFTPGSHQAIARKGHVAHEPNPATSGDFPQSPPKKAPRKQLLTPRAAGLLSNFYHSHKSNLAVLGELQTRETYTETNLREEISRRAAAIQFLKSLALSTTRGVTLPDWERRLPPDTKRLFALLALARHPNAKSISFRLGHEVAEAALRAKNGPTDYLARMLQRLGLTQTVFVIERSASESDENSPWHIHGIAIIPAELLAELTSEPIGSDGKSRPSKLRAALAPPPCNDSSPPIRGYRQRYNNKAIDIQPTRTASGWFQYITKEIDFAAHDLGARPDYASRSAAQDGKALYESIRTWIGTKPARKNAMQPT